MRTYSCVAYPAKKNWLLLTSGAFDSNIIRVISSRQQGYYLFKKILMSGKEWQCPDFEIEHCETIDGKYVGDWNFGRMLVKEGIAAEYKSPDVTVCSVGFQEAEQKWVGWSHRARCSFGIGDKLFVEDFGDDDTLFTEHGPNTITTLDEAKQAAINFADYVS